LSRRVISGLEEWLPPVLLQQRRVQKPAYSPAGPETSSRPACAQSKKAVRTLRTLAFFAALAPLCSTQSLSPNWEELTAEDFIHAVPQAQGSCAAFRHRGKARPFRTARHGPAKRALFGRTGGPTGSFGLRAVAPADKIAQRNLAVIGTILAQSDRGTITGLVSDPAAAVDAGAQVEINNAETGPSIGPLTCAAGNYTISACAR